MGSNDDYDPAEENSCQKCSEADNYDNLIECTGCKKWFHFKCANITSPEQADDDYFCSCCQAEQSQLNLTSVASSISEIITSQTNIQPTTSTNTSVCVSSSNLPIYSSTNQQANVSYVQSTTLPPFMYNQQNPGNQYNVRPQFTLATDCRTHVSSANQVYYNQNIGNGINNASVRPPLHFPLVPGIQPTATISSARYMQPPLQEVYSSEFNFTNQYSGSNTVEHNFQPQCNNNNNLELERMKALHEIEIQFLNAKLRNANSLNFNDSNKPTPNEYFQKLPSTMFQHRVLTREQLAARQVLDKIKLPVFDGKPEDWLRFIGSFEQSTAACAYSNVENLGRLTECLKGKALDHVRSCLISPDMIPAAIDTLRMIYGRPEAIITNLRAHVLKVPYVKNMAQCIDFSLKVQHLCVSIEATKVSEYLYDYTLIQELVNKLPDNLKLMWAMHSDGKSTANISEFSKWLTQIATISSKVTLYKPQQEKCAVGTTNIHSVSQSPVSKSHQSSQKPINASKSEGNEKFKCPICSCNEHVLSKCASFNKMNRNARWNVVQEYKLCRTCLISHNPRYCANMKNCGIDQCIKKHHPLLHNQQSTTITQATENVQQSQETLATTHMSNIDITVLYKIIPVNLYGANGKSVETLVFIDEGASVSLIENDLVEQLGIEGPTEPLRLNWTNGMFRTENHSKKISLNISGLGERADKFPINVRTVSNLSLPMQNSVDVNQFKHLKDLNIQRYMNSRPKILIGLDNYHIVMPSETREGNSMEPLAIKTKLGWAVFGRVGKTSTNESVFFFHDQKSNLPSENQEPSNEDLHSIIKEYFSIDSLGVRPSKTLISNENARALMIMEKTTKRVNDKFEIGLLWKHDKIKFPRNYEMALKRMINFEKKLSRDDHLRRNVMNQIDSYLEKQYIRKLRDDEPLFGDKVWYLPIFTVHNPNKPYKCRIVWDAAAQFDGVSLNSQLIKGPDLISSLPAILYRFREGKYAISGDIQEMYHQVMVCNDDQSAQRFIFRRNHDQPPEIYVMQVLTFGSTCSPSSAIYVMNKNANEYNEKHPRAVQAITKNHYIDDWLDSTNDENELKELAIRVRDIHKAAGFHITKWISNSQVVKESLITDEQPQGKNIGQTEDRVLGIWWESTKDVIGFSINFAKLDASLLDDETVPTKRQFLKVLMSIFDPIGVIAVIIVHGKIILQEIWRSSTGWDDQIKDTQYLKWKKWLTLLKTVQNVKIPRPYSTFKSSDQIELHTFVDASENSFAAVAYWRFIKNDKVEVNLIGGKTRVAPNKPLSIPRLELQAAILGSRFAKFIEESHTFTITKRYFWSDSANVLSWIHSDAREYKQFIAVRLGELLDSTEVSEWHWVPSKQNVADDATKWSNNTISAEHRWFKGPEFLLENKSCWPVQKANHPRNELELKVHVFHISELQVCTGIDITRFSRVEKLIRVQALVIRAVNCFKKKIKQRRLCLEFDKIDPKTRDEYFNAENILIKECQKDCYSEEIRLLKNNDMAEIKTSSKLYRYSPYLDENNVLRVKGRIDALKTVDVDTKRPIILPNPHPLTTLIAKSYHEKFLHMNFETAVNEVRRRFEIAKVRSLLKTIRKNCMQCKIIYAKPSNPLMSPLPISRVSVYERPFSQMAIDYFGPFNVSIGRRVEKRWGVLATCLTTRAISLEVACSLTTDSCIMALRRIFAIRGTPKRIISDQGTNFRGASRELDEAMRNVWKPELKQFFHQTEWQFIPPNSPHMGGSWERLVKTVKSNLYEMFSKQKITDEILKTTFFKVMQIVNCRPLTDVLIDTENEPALTPNDFLNIPTILEKPPGDILESEREISTRLSKSWKASQFFADVFWKRWLKEYLPTLTKRTKWFRSCNPIEVGNIVVICDESLPRGSWLKGRVSEVNLSNDGIVRSATVVTKQGTYTRPVVKLAVLDVGKSTWGDSVDLPGETVIDNTVA